MSGTSASRAIEAKALLGAGHPRGPTLITEREVMFSTAVAARSVRSRVRYTKERP